MVLEHLPVKFLIDIKKYKCTTLIIPGKYNSHNPNIIPRVTREAIAILPINKLSKNNFNK